LCVCGPTLFEGEQHYVGNCLLFRKYTYLLKAPRNTVLGKCAEREWGHPYINACEENPFSIKKE